MAIQIPSFSLGVRLAFQKLQSALAFEGWTMFPAFNTNHGLGRAALIASILGALLGIHVVLLILFVILKQQYTPSFALPAFVDIDRIQLLIQWCAYVISICTFHLAEFFTTAFYNPRVLSTDSFVVNHSYAYTAAAILSSLEFTVRFLVFPRMNNTVVMYIGVVMVIVAQSIRVVAIATCAESFNHLIQTSKRDNHVLVTHGIYKYLRHPSYVGFFYWAVGTQVLLCNPIHIVVFTCATWTFFQRRIPYEEESLRHHFPEEYPKYAARTRIGIPFLRTQ